MAYETLIFDIAAGVASVTLNRPAQMNAIDVQMAKELEQVAETCDGDAAVRCVILTGAGDRAFCTGGDVIGFAHDPGRVGALIKEMTTHLHAAISIFSHMKAPVIAKVNGAVAGAGLGLMAAADLAVSSQKARFAAAYTKIGLTPDGSTTWFLPRLIGDRRARELFLLNQMLSADAALSWGLVNQVVPAEELAGTVDALARQLAAGPTLAFGEVKRLMFLSDGNELEHQMRLEAAAIVETSGTADGLAGVRAFREKREPTFVGA